MGIGGDGGGVKLMSLYEQIGHLTSDDFEKVRKMLQMEPSVEYDEAVRALICQGWAALGWLSGTVQLSDRARAYLVKKLREALEKVEALEKK